MQSYLKTVMALLLMVSFTRMTAQVKTGYIIGVNMSSMTLKTVGLCSDQKTQTGIHFGGIFEIPVAGNLTFQPRVLLSAKGSSYKIDTVEYSISPIFIEIPVLAGYSFGSDEIRIFFYAGPYIACGIGGYKVVAGGEMQSINYGTGENKDLKHFDLGLNFGAGVSIRGFQISAQYGIGLANLSPVTTDDTEMKNKVLGISVSSLIARK
jgi:Outer membrane protein beta-barrel domain